jgi:hypothetical protein
VRRFADLYGQIAADRDHFARHAAALCLSGDWDAAAVAARAMQALQVKLDQMVTGVSPTDE